jgi:hypothetical protein
MPDSVNYGISATNISAHNLAVGQNASIAVSGDGQLDVRLAALLRAIQDSDEAPETDRELKMIGDEVAQALQQPNPNRRHVLDRLSKIASVAGSAGAIASAATTLARAVQAIV